MKKNRSTVSKAATYREIGEFWDAHDLADHWDKTRKADFAIDVETETTYFALDKGLSEKLDTVARERGVSADTLVNLWVSEKLQEQKA